MSEKRDVSILESKVQPSGHFSKKWDVTIPANHTLTDMLHPEYWAHTSRKFTPGDILYVYTDDESHFGMFYVTSAGRNHATIHSLLWEPLQKAPIASDNEYKYKWKGPSLKHCVIRKSDEQVVVDKLPTKDAALEWIAGQKKVA